MTHRGLKPLWFILTLAGSRKSCPQSIGQTRSSSGSNQPKAHLTREETFRVHFVTMAKGIGDRCSGTLNMAITRSAQRATRFDQTPGQKDSKTQHIIVLKSKRTLWASETHKTFQKECIHQTSSRFHSKWRYANRSALPSPEVESRNCIGCHRQSWRR